MVAYPDSPRQPSRALQWRIFLICWLVYLVHFSPFVTRELYLSMSLAERGTVQVPEYVDLHPDLFHLPGRGDFVGSNPGASYLAAIPYWLALPVINRVAPVRPQPAGKIEELQYRQDRRNRLKFYQKVRERGLDVRLGVAALLTSGFFMAPLAAGSAALLFRLLWRAGFGDTGSQWLAFLYALGTPVFLRAGTLSLNLLVALLSFAALALIWWPGGSRPEQEKWRYFAAGFLGGYAVATDYTGFFSLLAIGLYGLLRQLERKPFGAAMATTMWAVAGSIGPAMFLLWYQWHCYGNAWLPVQFHQPVHQYAGYTSARGFTWPQPAALWGLLFDAQYGLLVFAPVFALALYHPVLVARKLARIPANWAWAAWAHLAAIWVFSACLEYTLRHQWQDGVRYLVPALPPLFLLVADVMMRVPRWLAWPLVGYSLFTSWCVAMTRSHPWDAMASVLTHGPQFPWLTTLSSAARQYFPPLGDPQSAWSIWLPWVVCVTVLLCGGMIYHLTRPRATVN